jgi:hypothetical protein
LSEYKSIYNIIPAYPVLDILLFSINPHLKYDFKSESMSLNQNHTYKQTLKVNKPIQFHPSGPCSLYESIILFKP